MGQRTLFVALLIGILLLPEVALAQERAGPLAQQTPTWEAVYWNNKALTGSPALTRTEPAINYNWGAGSPAPGINADGFSVRWTVYFQVPAAAYRFTATSDDGMRVYLDGTLIIDEWYNHPAKTVSVERKLAAGPHLLVVEYYEDTGDAVARLEGARVDQPGEWRGEYYANPRLRGAPALVRNDARIAFDWGPSSPAPTQIPADRFSVRWTRDLNLAAGTYRFSARTDDGVRLWVGGRLVIDKWHDQPITSHHADVTVSGGRVPVRMEYYENQLTAGAHLTWTAVAPIAQWRGEYFPNRDLSGQPALVRDDGQIQFNWGAGSPAPGQIPADRFSARWTRRLDLQAGTYRFTVTADDGVRLWVNDRLVIDTWRDQMATSYSADVAVPAGGVPVRMEYYENLGDAVARLSWAPVGGSGEWSGEYYANRDLRGTPALTRNDRGIQFNWGAGSPASGRVPADNFSVRWTRRLDLQPGTYRFSVTVDDGVRLWVNNRLIIDQWHDQTATSYHADIALPAGGVPVVLEYYEHLGDAVARLNWAPLGQVANWRGEYYTNKNLSGQPALVRDDADIQFNWGPASPAPGVIPKDGFSVRWTRRLDLRPGTYRFSVTVDDGVRLWVNDRLVIDQWRDQSATTYHADVAIPGGGSQVRMEYYDGVVDAVARLSWVPVSQADGWRGEYYNNTDLRGTPAVVRDDAQIQFRWRTGSPAPGIIPADRFSVRWSRQLGLQPGTYRFTVTVDDGVRLWVNNRLVIDAWRVQAPTTYHADVQVPAGSVPVVMEYFENTGGATAQLSWAR